jgi:hypothetical protein
MMANHPLVQKWIEKSLHPPAKDYTFNMIKERLGDSIKIDFQSGNFCHVKHAITDHICRRISDDYKHLPVYAKAPASLNEGVSRSCRLFLGFPIAKHHGTLTQPLYNVDCYHRKCKMYSGVTMVFASKTGFGRTAIEAIAIIPNESTAHIAWMIQI